MDDLDTEFSNMYYDFVDKGGLDVEQSEVMNEDFQRMLMMRVVPGLKPCAHGLTALTCSHCYFHGYQPRL